jgi:Ca2+-binding EF-hand superfamily protein
MGSNQGKIDDQVYEAIAKFTELKRDDILAWQERFIQHCDPGSSNMNKEQFCKYYQELRPNENVKRLSENVFRAFDLDGDHGISFSEVCFHFLSLITKIKRS